MPLGTTLTENSRERSLVDFLKARGEASNFNSRRQLWNQFVEKGVLPKGPYVGTAKQNNTLYNLLVTPAQPKGLQAPAAEATKGPISTGVKAVAEQIRPETMRIQTPIDESLRSIGVEPTPEVKKALFNEAVNSGLVPGQIYTNPAQQDAALTKVLQDQAMKAQTELVPQSPAVALPDTPMVTEEIQPRAPMATVEIPPPETLPYQPNQVQEPPVVLPHPTGQPAVAPIQLYYKYGDPSASTEWLPPKSSTEPAVLTPAIPQAVAEPTPLVPQEVKPADTPVELTTKAQSPGALERTGVTHDEMMALPFPKAIKQQVEAATPAERPGFWDRLLSNPLFAFGTAMMGAPLGSTFGQALQLGAAAYQGVLEPGKVRKELIALGIPVGTALALSSTSETTRAVGLELLKAQLKRVNPQDVPWAQLQKVSTPESFLAAVRSGDMSRLVPLTPEQLAAGDRRFAPQFKIQPGIGGILFDPNKPQGFGPGRQVEVVSPSPEFRKLRDGLFKDYLKYAVDTKAFSNLEDARRWADERSTVDAMSRTPPAAGEPGFTLESYPAAEAPGVDWSVREGETPEQYRSRVMNELVIPGPPNKPVAPKAKPAPSTSSTPKAAAPAAAAPTPAQPRTFAEGIQDEEAAKKLAALLAQREEDRPKIELGLQNYLTKSEAVDSIIDKAINQAGTWTAGLLGYPMAQVWGTPAYGLRASLDTIKANIGFEELNAMRQASPTGGALGQVAVQEIHFLQSVLGSLDQFQSPGELKAALRAIKERRAQLKSNLLKSYQEIYGVKFAVPQKPGDTGGKTIDWKNLK